VVRRAGAEDAGELTRLRVVMFAAMGADLSLLDEAWQTATADHFRKRLAEVDRFAAFVVDAAPGRLAATAVGWLDRHLPSGTNLSGDMGYIANMSTAPEWRGRGCGRATLTALLDWMRSRGVQRVDLHATASGEPLYRSVGFTPPSQAALTLRLD
jgi:GNAT superfamily N-acetyltransferase